MSRTDHRRAARFISQGGGGIVASKADIFITATRDATAMIDELETDGIDPRARAWDQAAMKDAAL